MMVTVLFHLSHAFDFSEGQNEEAALRQVHPYDHFFPNCTGNHEVGIGQLGQQHLALLGAKKNFTVATWTH